MDVDGIILGDSFANMIESALKKESDTLIVLANKAYLEDLNDPPSWVSTELQLACRLGKGVIVIDLENVLSSEYSLLGLPVIDFSGWEQHYHERLESLVRWFK